MTQAVDNFHAITERTSFSSLLPYIEYDRDADMYRLDDGIGFILEALPLQLAGLDTYNQMKSLFEIQFPINTSLSFFMFADPNIRPIVSNWSAKRAGDGNPDPHARGFGNPDRRKSGIYAELARERFQFISKGVWDPLHQGLEVRFRNFRLIISCKIPVAALPSGWRESIRVLNNVRASVIQQLKTMGVHTEPMDADSLIQVLSFMLNPDHPERVHLRYTREQELRKQILFSDSVLRIKDQFLKIDKSSVVLQTVKQYPDQIGLWDMANLLGDPMSNAKQIPAPFISVMHVFFPDPDLKKNKLKATGTATTFQGLGRIAQYVPYMGMKKDNFDIILKDLDAGAKPVQVCHQLVIYGRTDDEAISAGQAASALYQTRGFVLQSDQLIGVPLFINALPLGFLINRQDKLVRLNTLTSKRAACLVPVAAEYKGTRSQVMQFTSRIGQMVYLDFFENTTGNYNAAITASSGGGKSFFMSGRITDYRARNAKVYVIDVGRSYQALNELLGGKFIEFSTENALSLNPFSNLERLDDEVKQTINPLIAQMCSPSRSVTDWEKSTIEKAVAKVFDRMKQETTIDAIAADLEAHPDPRGKDLGVQLYTYTSTGSRGRWFKGKNNLDITNPFLCLELEELRRDPELQQVVLYLVINNIGQSIYLGDRSTKQIVIFDEAWSLMTDGAALPFMEGAYRRFRKYGASAIMITQGINDFYKSAATQACLANSDTMCFLRQKAESLVALKESKRLMLSEHEYDLLGSVHTQAGQYSEIFWVSPMGRVLVRDYSDPFSYWVYTTTPHEVALRKSFRQEFGPVQTIQCCVMTQDQFRASLRAGKSINESINMAKNFIFRNPNLVKGAAVPERFRNAGAEIPAGAGRA